MSPTASVVPFSHLLAIRPIFFKTSKSFKIQGCIDVFYVVE